MKKNNLILSLILPTVLLTIIITVVVRSSNFKSKSEPSKNANQNYPTDISIKASYKSETLSNQKIANQISPKEIKLEPATSQTKAKIDLHRGNFEGFVNKCFEGDNCIFAEDPSAMYKHFKQIGNSRACDLLISFLRSKMNNVEYKKRYKNDLIKMVEDFYPPEEKQFQEAALYNYVGDLQKSLDLYLDLERKSLSDSSLRSAPNLNIANTFYDLGRFKESLPYYQSALNEYISNKQEVTSPSQNEMIQFIEGRIEDVKKQL